MIEINNKDTLKITKWVAGGVEAFLAIPVLGASVIMSFLWIPLGLMIALHIVNLVFSKKFGENKTGSIIGIVGNAIGWIPFVGWIFHIITAIFVMREAYLLSTSVETINLHDTNNVSNPSTNVERQNSNNVEKVVQDQVSIEEGTDINDN